MMRKTYVYWLVGLVFIMACENNIVKPEEIITNDDTKVEIASDVEMLYSDSAIVRVRIKAPTLLNHIDKSNPKKEFPDGIAVDFFNKRQQVSSRLTAKYAVQIEYKNIVVVRDSVVVYSANNERLKTEALTWNDFKEEVYTNRFVEITTPTEVIKGYGFKSDQNFTNWEIKKVTGQVASETLKKEF